MRALILILSFVFVGSAFAAQDSYFMVLKDEDVFKDQQINQYDDSDDPPQAFLIEVPKGWRSDYWATPDDGDGKLCVVEDLGKGRRFTVKAPNLDTDAGGCYAFFIYMNFTTGEQKTVSYYIEQTGT